MKIHAQHQILDKWVQAISPQESAQDAVSYSLRNRIATLQHFFPRAAISEVESHEDVHQLRVATRRVSAVLDLYAKLLPTKPTKLLHRSLRKIQRVAGTVRDLDVLAKRYRQVEHNNGKKLVKALHRRRLRLQLRLTRLYLWLRGGDRFLNQIEKLLKKTKESDTPNGPVGIWMKTRWSQLVEQFDQSTDFDTEDLEALHRFRIQSKQLRYSMELLAPAFDFNQLERAYALVERLQERLGQIQDHVIARKTFREWETKRNRISRMCDLKLLIESEDAKLRQQLRDVATWWTPMMKSNMRQAFEQIASATNQS